MGDLDRLAILYSGNSPEHEQICKILEDNICHTLKLEEKAQQSPLSKEEIEQVENHIFDLAFDLELESGIVINPVLENEAHYRYWLGALPFYNNVEKEGIVIG